MNDDIKKQKLDDAKFKAEVYEYQISNEFKFDKIKAHVKKLESQMEDCLNLLDLLIKNQKNESILNEYNEIKNLKKNLTLKI